MNTTTQEGTPDTDGSTAFSNKQGPYYDGDVFGPDRSAVIMSARGTSRVSAALSAIEAIAAVLMQNELDRESDEDCCGIGANTALGLIQAIGICADFASDHVDGTSLAGYCCNNFDKGHENFERIESLQQQFREEKVNARRAAWAPPAQ